MGIDVYMMWPTQTEEERRQQFNGFDVHSGHIGYLREAYNGGPYATTVLMPECWEFDGEYDRLIEGGEPVRWDNGAYTVLVPDPAYPTEPSICVRYPVHVLQERLDDAIEACQQRYTDVEDEDWKRKACGAYEAFVEMYAALDRMGKEPAVHISY